MATGQRKNETTNTTTEPQKKLFPFLTACTRRFNDGNGTDEEEKMRKRGMINLKEDAWWPTMTFVPYFAMQPVDDNAVFY